MVYYHAVVDYVVGFCCCVPFFISMAISIVLLTGLHHPQDAGRGASPWVFHLVFLWFICWLLLFFFFFFICFSSFLVGLSYIGIKLFSLNLIVSEQLCIPPDPGLHKRFRHLPNLQQGGDKVG